MKFQNPSIHHSKVNTHTDRHTDRQAESNMPFQLFQSWGHKNINTKPISHWLATTGDWFATKIKDINATFTLQSLTLNEHLCDNFTNFGLIAYMSHDCHEIVM